MQPKALMITDYMKSELCADDVQIVIRDASIMKLFIA